jgi:adenylate kinase
VDEVNSLEVPEDELKTRILKRATIEGRSDDTAEGLAQRLVVYRQDTAPVLDHYRSAGTHIKTINGVGDIDAITERIIEALGRNGAAVGSA